MLSASGAISKGAYQAGVTWSIVEYLRRYESLSTVNFAGVQDTSRPAAYNLVAATGASAGNIIALLASLAWCTDSTRLADGRMSRAIPLEESLFWRVWVNVGISELMPEAAGPRRGGERESAVYDRQFFVGTVLPQLDTVMQRSRVRPRCEIPVGLTMTRNTPVELPVLEGVNARVQRFATVFMLKGAEAAPPRFRLAPPPEELARQSLGALALSPTLLSSHSTDSDRLKAVFELMLASSSFPVAFAPREITYMPAGMRPSEREAGAGTKAVPAMFSDGGVFDNNPIGLALRLWELQRTRGSESAVPARPSMNGEQTPTDSFAPNVIFVSPGSLRGRRGKRPGPPAPQQQTGLGSVLQLVGGMYSAASDYELHSLGRRLASSKESGGTPNVGALQPKMQRSTRAAPIVGEHLHSFAAFLGRGFREYDFYTGVYDGLEFVARNIICGERVGLDQDACARAAHERLVRDNVLETDPVASTVQMWHWRREYLPDADQVENPAGVTGLDDVTRWRLALLQGIDRGLQASDSRPPAGSCEGGIVQAQLCATGFDVVLRVLHQDVAVRRAALRLCDWCMRPENRTARRRGECTVDPIFEGLLADPEHQLNDLFEVALDNLWEAEDGIKNGRGQTRELSSAIEFVHMLYRGGNDRLRRGVEINPSSARVRRGDKWTVAASATGLLLPNYVTLYGWTAGSNQRRELPLADNGSRHVNGVALGWHPLVWYTPWPVDVVTVAEGYKYRYEGPNGKRGWDFTPGVLARVPGMLSLPLVGSTTVELGALYSRHQFSVVTRENSERVGILHLSLGFLDNRVKIAARKMDGRPVVTNLSIADVNGLLYWWLR